MKTVVIHAVDLASGERSAIMNADVLDGEAIMFRFGETVVAIEAETLKTMRMDAVIIGQRIGTVEVRIQAWPTIPVEP